MAETAIADFEHWLLKVVAALQAYNVCIVLTR